jgi:asparagine synthase (glutamine-hydrolysing)
MCGINGIVSKLPVELATITKMNMTLRHRGPDAQGSFRSEAGTVALGHTRLSIIDITELGNQPMYSADGRFVVVFNGEIYNFKILKKAFELDDPEVRFKTNSDTEIILHAFKKWGLGMAHRLEGMFAIALYDKVLDKLYLFRDRVGKKPLFYFWNNQHFIFASEIKALLQHPSVSLNKEIDIQAIHHFLHLGYIPEPLTIYRSIRKFPAGSIGEISRDLSVLIKPFWKPVEKISQTPRSNQIGELKNVLHKKLHHAVEKRLISDVPLGTFLSGGTDSSLVTAVASSLIPMPLKTFSIGFKESKFDEHRYAALVAAQLKTHHHEYILSEREAANTLETYLDQMDEPFADTSTIPTMLVAQMAKKEVKVALTGDGGDELFLGYGTYAWANRLSNPIFKFAQPFMSLGFRNILGNRYKRIAFMLDRIKKENLRSHIFSQEQYFFSNAEIQNQLVKDVLNYEAFTYNDPKNVSHFTDGEKQALFDLKYYLKDDLLVKIDRASMYNSLECRCPLLDHEIIEFALNAPVEIKRNKGINKWVLKELLKDYLTENLVNRPKWGFSIPLALWMKTELNFLLDYLTPENLEKTGLFKIGYVSNLVSRFNKGEDYLYNRLWALIIIQRFILKNL